eukprot:1303815-Pleurochrysis_carterae.AAC.2
MHTPSCAAVLKRQSANAQSGSNRYSARKRDAQTRSTDTDKTWHLDIIHSTCLQKTSSRFKHADPAAARKPAIRLSLAQAGRLFRSTDRKRSCPLSAV